MCTDCAVECYRAKKKYGTERLYTWELVQYFPTATRQGRFSYVCKTCELVYCDAPFAWKNIDVTNNTGIDACCRLFQGDPLETMWDFADQTNLNEINV